VPLGGSARAVVQVSVTVLVLAVCASACGSDGGPLSAATFTRRATAMCAHADRRAAAVEIPALDAHGTAGALTTIISIEQRAIHDLHALRPPRSLEARVDEWLATLDQLVVEAEFLRESIRTGERQIADAIAVRAARLSLRSQVLAGRVGVSGCTMPTPPPVDPSVE
jgi:hypothetical protein